MPKALNILAAILLLLVLFPFLFITLLLAALSTRSTGIFTQIRIGQHGKPFAIYKLQTMINGQATTTGRILRKSKIDELPQLINILKGDMSFVGPRPDVPGYYDVLKGEQRKVLALKPGLTSLAALKYRYEDYLLEKQQNPQLYNNNIIFPDKIKMNLEYLEKRSVWYDLKIIALTIKSSFN